MQKSNLEGIERNGALAQKRGDSFRANPDYYDDDANWHSEAPVWAAGWRKADGGKDEALAVLDRVRYW